VRRGAAEQGWDGGPPLGVDVPVVRAADVPALERRHPLAEPLLGGESLLEPLPRRERVDIEARTVPPLEPGDDQTGVVERRQLVAEASRDGDSPLGVDRVQMIAAKHARARGASLPIDPK